MQDIANQFENDSCADCQCYGPECVNLTALTFICQPCANMLLPFNHHIQNLFSSSKVPTQFTLIDTKLMSLLGNRKANEIWLNGCDMKFPGRNNSEALRAYLTIKYSERRWFDAEKMNALRKSVIVDEDMSLKMMDGLNGQNQVDGVSGYKIEEHNEYKSQLKTRTWSLPNTKPQPSIASWFTTPKPVVPKPKPINIKPRNGDQSIGTLPEVLNASPTKTESQYSLAAWSNYFSQPEGYCTVESKRSNMFS